jgi:hypothetical protein
MFHFSHSLTLSNNQHILGVFKFSALQQMSHFRMLHFPTSLHCVPPTQCRLMDGFGPWNGETSGNILLPCSRILFLADAHVFFQQNLYWTQGMCEPELSHSKRLRADGKGEEGNKTPHELPPPLPPLTSAGWPSAWVQRSTNIPLSFCPVSHKCDCDYTHL